MKKYFIYFILLVGVLACSDDFTNSPAVGALSDEALQNETGVDLMLIGAYSALDGVRDKNFGEGWAQSGDNWIMDVLSDDAHKGSTDGDQPELYNIEVMNWQTGSAYFLGKWAVVFAGINRANAVISLINGIEGGNFNAQMAEARFLRAHFNFELQKMWVNVPYISDENYTNTEFNQPNPGPIWDKIEADLMFAMDNLPSEQDFVGKPNSWVARAFLAKALLYQNKHAEALPLFKSVVESGPYSLVDNYNDNFSIAGDNSVESMFSIQFTTDDSQSYNGNVQGALNFPNPGPFGSCCGFYQPTQDLLNAFQTSALGLPLLDTWNQTDVNSDFGIDSSVDFTPFAGNLDPRADYTVGRRGIDYNGYGENIGNDWIRAEYSDISGSYLPKKNVYQSGETGNQATGGWGQQLSGINYHIMRFADVMLMYAECEVEAGDPAIAMDMVNQIRERAMNSSYVQKPGGGDAAKYVISLYPGSGLSQDFARKAVRFERRLELGMEGHRLFDLRRWGVAEAVLNEYYVNEGRTITPFATEHGTYTSTNNAFPIPINAIDQSGNILTQNTGY